jgi:hypothetical protein
MTVSVCICYSLIAAALVPAVRRSPPEARAPAGDPAVRDVQAARPARPATEIKE